MPFSSSPVNVNPGDSVQVRYPTPGTWNTQVLVNVKIGTGSDPDGITFGTKIPDALPQTFTFTDQQGFTGAFNGSSSSGATSTFQRNTTYYSGVIDISSIEIPIPASISAVSNGPKNSNTNNTTAQFRIYRGGAFDSWRTSISANIANGTGGLQPGDKVQLRVQVPDWYVTSTLVTFNVGDETFGTNIGQPSTSFSRQWGITTRAQDQNINQYAFTDRVDQIIPADGGSDYFTYNVPIIGLDGDVVLRATSTGDVEISADNSNWSQSIGDQLVLNDTLYTRIRNGPNYTQKRTGTLNVFAVGGDSYTRGSNFYENTTAGTYGAGLYLVTQTLGTVTDNWQSWTEVDRYPNPVDASPIFTYGANFSLNAGQDDAELLYFIANAPQSYTVSGGTGNSMIIRVTSDGFANIIVIDPGYGYTIGDQLTITGAGNNAVLTLVEYEKILVSADSTHNRAEPSYMYFADVPISGLGTEYASGIYNDLEAPFTNLGNNDPTVAQNTVATLNGQTVKIDAIIDGTDGFIRKNNTGTWIQQLIVQNGDVINLKMVSSTTYGVNKSASVRIQGPPDSGAGNPTGGPSPTFAEKVFTMGVNTREARTVPYPFHATPVYLSNPGVEQIAEVTLEGLDQSTTASITGGVGSLSADGVNWGSSVTILSSTEILYVRQNASTGSGGLAQLTYRVGTSADIFNGTALFDTFRVYTKQFNVLGDFITEEYFGEGFTSFSNFNIPAFAGTEFFLTLIGAGGGFGGRDIPGASTGGPGGAGNQFRVKVNIPTAAWPTNAFGNPDFNLRIYPADAGENGSDYVTGTGGGTGGFGYAYGGDGGNSGSGDPSGAGGGGGGASAVTLSDGTLIAMVGGGGGGGGAGNDVSTPLSIQYGNYNGHGSVSTSTVNISISGDDAPDRTGQGGGPGGGGGGYDGSAGTLINTYTENGVTLQSDDLDATGGNGGGAFYNTTYCTPLGASTVTGQGAAAGEEGAVYIEYSQQDTTPDPYGFSPYDGANIQETVESSIEQITGITGEVDVSVTSPGFTSAVRICSSSSASSCGSYVPSALIGNGQYVQVQATTGNQFFTTYTAEVVVGDASAFWDINTGPPPDSIPNPFFLQALDNVQNSTLVESEEITVSGITVPVTITSVGAGAEISVNGGTYVPGVPGATITNGQTFKIRLTSSPDFFTAVTTEVTVGNGDSVDWVVTTAVEADSTPDTYTWIYKVGADLLTPYESNTELIQGLGTEVDFIVEQGAGDQGANTDLAQIIKNGVNLGAGVTTTKINNFDTLALAYTTSGVVGETRVFNTKLGLANSTAGFFETPWSVITAGQFGTDPNDFAFASQLASGPGSFTEAAETITISGLSNGITIGLYGTNGVQINVGGTGYNSYTVGNQANVTNGTQFTIRLRSSDIPGFTRTAFIFAGSFVAGYSVQTPASVQDPIRSQWYSSITPCKYIGNTFSGQQIRINTKFDGLPVGAIMPVFQDGTESNFWGKLDGKPDSRFPSFVYCDGSYYDPAEYPLLFSVLEYDYGAKNVGGDVYFRVPDYRNKYVKGTGVIDGNAQSSPGLVPSFKATKQSGAPGNEEPGAFGGMWFVDTIGDPGVDELEQVITPATGQPAQESDYFGIAQVSTTGYSDVGGLIEFFTSGKTTCPVGIDAEKIYDTPLHFHDLITGQSDPGKFKGRINWGGQGGYGGTVTSPLAASGAVGTPSASFTSEGQININLWGYGLQDYELRSENLPGSTVCTSSEPEWWDGSKDDWSNGMTPGLQGTDDIGTFGKVDVVQNGIGTAEYNDIDNYIDINNKPFTGNTGAFGSDNITKFLGSVDIPDKTVTIKSYNPVNKLKHNHYVSLTAIDDELIFGYGNNETGGTASAALSSFSGGIQSSVDLEFSALDVGIQVLPGTFTLQQTKQLIPIPSFSPSDQVPIVTPYVWTKWMIKAF